MRMRWLIDRCLGRKHQRSKILGPISVQVKAPDRLPTGSRRAPDFDNGTAWMLRRIDAFWRGNAARFSGIQNRRLRGPPSLLVPEFRAQYRGGADCADRPRLHEVAARRGAAHSVDFKF
jgi:hypothetical protein